ncbi:MAG TPA: branched-chain amino acid ABC transporter permease [Anaerolineales bacterium]|nr:branched-chain amino acid ABC transporter permease [Anaerolineales bacterium]
MKTPYTSTWKLAIQTGLLAGGIAVLLSLVGMVESFSQRFIIRGVFTMGQVLFLAPALLATYAVLRRTTPQTTRNVILLGLLTGLASGVALALLVLLGSVVDLRATFVNASPRLYSMLLFGQTLVPGILILLVVNMVMGLLASGIFLLPQRIRAAVVQGLIWVLLVGLLRDLILTVTGRWGPLGGLIRSFFAASGLTLVGALIVFALITGVDYWRSGRPVASEPLWSSKQKPAVRWLTIGGIVLLLLLLPPILGIFFSDILDTVFMYILMGLGLNIVIGFAGLLDLGYVAFFAIGAYTMGVLTSPELNADPMTYWQALPFAMIACVIAGLILGLPVLKMRGDYLAIVTLGFGEIVRLLALSDWLRPWFGGSQGIQLIAQPRIGNFVLNTQQELYYLFLIGVGLVAFVAWRLRDSRVGRTWMAIREDEDVAVAMGINHVAYKLMAFATGALFSGIAGTIFAAKLQSVYPHSMNFLVSINVLSLIIIGGMGSIPGVFVGALVLMGLPELLREFAEFRYLVYGALLVAMMLTRPEGLWPEERRRLELHESIEPTAAAVHPESGVATETTGS